MTERIDPPDVDFNAAITPGQFGAVMSSIGFFETPPVVAVGVSGGADSMALVRLLDRWTRNLGGRVVGLSVDHGLRPEAIDEAYQVATWLRALNIDHHILTWLSSTDKKPKTAIQAKARLARRALMLNWCGDAGVLHLAFAHHLDDQVETYLMRDAKNSGPLGLAGMNAIGEFPQARVIRPLLKFPKSRLLATLKEWKQDWIEDPSNEMDQFERVRIRKSLAGRADKSGETVEIAQKISKHAQSRCALDKISAAVIAKSVKLYPAGYAVINPQSLISDGDDAGMQALGRVVFAIGGREYGAERAKLKRAFDALKESELNGELKGGLTLGGCRIVDTETGYLICRENRNLPPKMFLHERSLQEKPHQSGQTFHWDQRFSLTLISGSNQELGYTVEPLGEEGWAEIVSKDPSLRASPIPLIARYSLPVLKYQGKIIQVPLLEFDDRKQDELTVNLQNKGVLPREPLLSAIFVDI